MRVQFLSYIILLTLFVGISHIGVAQVTPSDSSHYPQDSLLPKGSVLTDSLPNGSDTSQFSLSTDSAYATPIQQPGLVDADIIYSAEDSILGSISSNIIELYNEAQVEYEDIKLRAGYIRINFKTNEMFASGLKDTAGITRQKPIFTEAGKDYRANEMRYNFNSSKAKLKKIITSEGDGFLHGERVKKMENEVFYIRNASYTTCSHEVPHYRIVTPQAKVISNTKIVTRFAFLELLEVPTPLVLPFGFFPTTSERQSGIIIPSYGSSQFRGFFLRDGGYYWAINDYVDLSMRGDIYTQGGFALNAQSTYRKRYKFNGNLALDFDRLKFGREEFDEFVGAAFQNQTNFSIRWSHNQDAKAHPTNRFSANVNIASTNYNQVTQTQPQEALQNRLNSSISFSKRWQGKPFNFNVTLRHSQNNQSKQLNLTLPQFNFSVNRLSPFERKVGAGSKKWYEKINLSYTLNGQNSINTTMDTPNLLEDILTKGRAGLQHSIPISANYKLFKFVVFSPSINFTERWYPSKLEYDFNPDSNTVLIDTVGGFFANRDFGFNTNFSTNLYGTWRSKGFLRALRHKMIPSVGFSYRPDFSTSFWGYYQNVQTDTLGNFERRNQFANGVYGSASQGTQGNVNFNLQNTLEAKIKDSKDSSGVKKISILERLSLSTSYNMAAEKFQWNDLRLNASSTLLNRLVNMNYNASLDFYGVEQDTAGNFSRVNEFAIKVNGTPFRLKSQSLTMGVNLNANTFKGDKSQKPKKENRYENLDQAAPAKGAKKEDNASNDGEDDAYESSIGITGGDVNYYRQREYNDFSLPWSLRINYNLNDNRQLDGEKNISQALRFSGNLDFTKNWKVGFSSGYDLKQKDFTYTSMNFTRELHCWVMTFNWIPFGFQQSYVLTIRVRSNILSDLKVNRRRGLGDFQRDGF